MNDVRKMLCCVGLRIRVLKVKVKSRYLDWTFGVIHFPHHTSHTHTHTHTHINTHKASGAMRVPFDHTNLKHQRTNPTDLGNTHFEITTSMLLRFTYLQSKSNNEAELKNISNSSDIVLRNIIGRRFSGNISRATNTAAALAPLLLIIITSVISNE